MTRSEMIDFIKANPYIPITHRLFDDSEYIYSDSYGTVLDENGNVFEDWYSPYICDGIRLRDYDVWQNDWEIKKGIELCKYKLVIPNIGLCCGAYWAHYPNCTEENCPLKHPELLEGRVLESEE